MAVLLLATDVHQEAASDGEEDPTEPQGVEQGRELTDRGTETECGE